MSKVRLTRELIAEGSTHSELARQTRSGQLVHVRRGAYDASGQAAEKGAAEHRRLVVATVPMLHADSVVSHLSAAVLHGLPVFADQLARVQVTRPGRGGGKSRSVTSIYTAPLDDSEIVDVAGVRTTSLARTVVDTSRTLPFDQAVMVADAALSRGLAPEALDECLKGSMRRPGMPNARRVAHFADARSESPGESLSRVALHTVGVPAPSLQHEIFDSSGQLVGRSDFCWEEHRTLGEFDGRVKYGRLLKPGQSLEDVLFREKLREDALRDLGWEIVRWIWADLKRPQVIAERLERAFARGSRRWHMAP
jgi:hypothetical protein